MAVTYGFYNALDGDRAYNAEQMTAIFDGIINDGVFSNIGSILGTRAGEGMQVVVASGRAWLAGTWTDNDADLPLVIAPAHVTLARYDAVVIEANHNQEIRTNTIKVITGTPASAPVKPTLVRDDLVTQMALAYILVPAQVETITGAMVQVTVGTTEAPFVTGILQTATIEALFQQWDYQFQTWFADVQAQLEGDVVANLLYQIGLRLQISDKATSTEASEGANDAHYMTPSKTLDFFTTRKATAAEATAGTDDNKYMTPAKSVALSEEIGFGIGDVKITAKNTLGNKWLLCNGEILALNPEYDTLRNILQSTWSEPISKTLARPAYIQQIAIRIINGYMIYIYQSNYMTYSPLGGDVSTTITFNRSDFWPTDISYIDGQYVIFGEQTYSGSYRHPAIATATSLESVFQCGMINSTMMGYSGARGELAISSTYVVGLVRWNGGGGGGGGNELAYCPRGYWSNTSYWGSYSLPVSNPVGSRYETLHDAIAVGDNVFICGKQGIVSGVNGPALVKVTNTPNDSASWKSILVGTNANANAISMCRSSIGNRIFVLVIYEGLFEIHYVNGVLSATNIFRAPNLINGSVVETQNGIIVSWANTGETVVNVESINLFNGYAIVKSLPSGFTSPVVIRCPDCYDNSGYPAIAFGNNTSLTAQYARADFYGKAVPLVSYSSANGFIKAIGGK